MGHRKRLFTELRGPLGSTEHAWKSRPSRPVEGQRSPEGPYLLQRKNWFSSRLQAVRVYTGSSDIRQPRSQTLPELPEEADVRLTSTDVLPLRAGRGGLWPSVHAPPAAHAPSSRRLRSASPGRLRSLVESAPARSLGALHLRLPPLTPRGGSGPGGTMFTSTGSSGLCEYRFSHP